MSSRYGIYTADFVHDGGTLALTQLRGQGLRRGAGITTVRPGGSLDPAAHILSSGNPSAGFATRDLATLLGGLSLTTGLTCSGGHVMRYQRRAIGGFAGGTTNVTQTTARGFLNPVEISVDQESENGAEATLEYVPLSDAQEAPVSSASGVNFSAVTAPAFNSVFYLGGAWLGAAQLPSLSRIRVAPGILYAANREDGGAFAKYGCSFIRSRTPVIELTFFNVGLAPDVIGGMFAAALSSTLSVYFQRGLGPSNIGRVAVGTAQHVKVSAAGGIWGPEDISVSEEEDGRMTVLVQPTGALSVSTASAIP